MIDIILAIIIVAQLVYIAYRDREHREGEAKLINALIAKNPQQLVDLTIADKVKTDQNPNPIPEDWIPESQLSDEEFEKKVIKGGLNG